MSNQLNHKGFYYLILLLGFFLMVVALGPGLFDDTEQSSLWQHTLFSEFCHQDPGRSFSLSGLPMAVCSRCLGIYASFVATWLMVPVVGKFFKRSAGFYGRLLMVILFIISIDVILNMAGVWSNTNVSRLVTGMFLGSVISFALGTSFLTNK